MLNRKNLSQVVLLLVLCLFMVGVAQAFQTPTPTPTPPVPATLPVKIIAIAAVVTSVLQGLKKFIPQINGWVAVLLSVVLAIAGTFATATPGQVVSIQFLSTAILSALGANGIYSFAQITSSKTATIITDPKKGG